MQIETREKAHVEERRISDIRTRWRRGGSDGRRSQRPGLVIPGIRFLCRRVGNIEPSSANHSELLWVDEERFRNMPGPEFVGNLKLETIELLERYRRLRR